MILSNQGVSGEKLTYIFAVSLNFISQGSVWPAVVCGDIMFFESLDYENDDFACFGL